MRTPPARRVAGSALCAALLLGAAAPAALAAGTAPERIRTPAPAPEVRELLARAESLGGVGEVLDPVGELVEAVLKADGGRLGAAEAEELGEEAREAIAEALGAVGSTGAGPGPGSASSAGASAGGAGADADAGESAGGSGAPAPGTSAEPAPPSAPSAPSAPSSVPSGSAPSAPVAPAHPEASASTLPAPLPPLPSAEPTATASTLPAPAERARAPRDLPGLLADLQQAVDALLAAATSGDFTEVLSAVDAVLDVVADLLAGVVGGIGRPVVTPGAADPADVSVLPADPALGLPADPTAGLPADPTLGLPADPTQTLPAEAGEAAAPTGPTTVVHTASTLPAPDRSVPSP